jgi:hypothetical protein
MPPFAVYVRLIAAAIVSICLQPRMSTFHTKRWRYGGIGKLRLYYPLDEPVSLEVHAASSFIQDQYLTPPHQCPDERQQLLFARGKVGSIRMDCSFETKLVTDALACGWAGVDKRKRVIQLCVRVDALGIDILTMG